MFKIAILVSGTGSNMLNIIESFQGKSAEILTVFADRPCKALEKAQDIYNIPTKLLNKKDLSNLEIANKVHEECVKLKVDLIVLAGFLSIIGGKILEDFENKIINIHPSLLPKYGGPGMYGMNVHNQVIKNQENTSGCTVHFVTKDVDQGKIILQKQVKVEKNDTGETLQKRILIQEHIAIIEAINILIKQHEDERV